LELYGSLTIRVTARAVTTDPCKVYCIDWNLKELMVFSTLKKNHISGHWSRALSSWACISSSFLFRSTHVPWFSGVISPHDNWQQFITHVGSLHFFFFCCDPQYSMLSRTTKQLASTSHYPLVSCLILQYFISWLSEKSLSRDPITEAIKQKLWLRSPNQHTLSTHKLSPGPCRELTKPDSDTASPCQVAGDWIHPDKLLTPSRSREW
jgi:hypothetical protein